MAPRLYAHSRARPFVAICMLWTLQGCSDFRECPAVPVAITQSAPTKLSETGLYADMAARTLAPGVAAYRPEFALWSDGADKERYIWLPEGATVDSTDMDDWRFPEGTKLWKEFSRDGTLVETRLLQKLGQGDADWLAVAYVWDEAGDDADVTWQGQANARGTEHDVPAAQQCMGCHAGRNSRVLGFSAVQLTHAQRDGSLDLSTLASQGRLSRVPEVELTPPGDEVDRGALGYLHANCSHCHNQARPDADGPRCYDPDNSIDFRLLTANLDSVSSTPAVRTTVRLDNRRREMLERMNKRDGDEQMPPLASERVDTQALALMRTWLARF